MILTITANPAVDRAYSVAELVIGEVHRPTAMNATAGGKGLNVARVASILGAEVAAMGFIGGSNGAFIASELKKLGFRDSFTRISGETRICINIADAQGRSTELLESGPVIQPLEKRQFLQDFSANLKQSSIITASGSLPKGLDGSFYCQLVQLAREKGKPMIVDTSGAALQAVLGAKPFMVKPNRSELSRYLGREIAAEQDLQSALQELHSQGIEIPLVTLGGDGAMACIDGSFYRFTAPRVQVKSAVGSGDSTIAGIAVGLEQGLPVVDAIRLGMAAGAANTQFLQTGFISRELVEEYYPAVKAVKC